jgi:WhiB family redox-sensing transcriptional regulator
MMSEVPKLVFADEPNDKTPHIAMKESYGDPAWMQLAECRSEYVIKKLNLPDAFFPRSENLDDPMVIAAKRICNRCVVKKECLNYAIDLRMDHGIFGGATASQRVKMRR